MDEDDSQDEMINRNVSHGKGKRPVMSIVSNDEENSEDGESETDSEEEEMLDGEEEDDDSEDEDSGKVLEGAVGNVPVDLVDLSSDEDSEKCPICLNSFHEQPIATPEVCEHYFCLDCILEWSQNANSCPVDRKDFSKILLRKCYGGKVQKTIAVQKPVKPGQEEQVDLDLDQTSCEVCGGRDREDRLLLCDGCDAGYHMECLTPPLNAVPVEEWFCPECIANNRSSNQMSEEDSSSLPTTSHSRSRPTRAIARTQHSERVRANVNRHRITQARTASQFAPRYLMQSTWLDETINAVVAGLNTAVYIRDLTPRRKSSRRRRTAKRRRTKGKLSQKASSGGNTNLGVKRRKRKTRRSKSRRKLVIKRETNSRSRIAKSLGIAKHSHSSVPTVYRPMENSLGSMRAEIGAASLSVYGDPFDLDPFDDREDEIQVSTPPSVLDAKRRGLSRSALRSHQPVARPIAAGLSRRGVSMPQIDEVEADAPVSDLLGSILSGQSLLLMDSSDVVINRDGSLKATKPVSLSLPSCNTPRGSSSGETTDTPNSETGSIYRNGEAGPSSSPLRRPPSAHSSPGYCSTPQNPTSPCSPSHSPHFHYPHPSSAGHPRLHPGLPSRPNTLNSQRPGDGLSSTSGIGGQPISKGSSKFSDFQDKGGTSHQPAVKKLLPKPVWEGVSALPRIPKIKKEGTCSSNSTSGGSSNSLPDSSSTNLAGNTGRERTVDQQGTSNSQSNRTMDAQRQRSDRTGASSTFSSSFTSTSSSFGASSNSRPSSSSISFRISSSGNPWHARRLPVSGETLPGKKNDKSKRMLLSLKSQAKEVKSEVYDPFNPTGSDSSDSEPENEGSDVSTQNTESRMPAGTELDACHQIKSEPVDVDMERSSKICAEVKEEQESFSAKPCKQSPFRFDTFQIQAPSGGLDVGSISCEARIDADQTEDCFKSALSSSDNVKIEVKSEPEAGPPPVRPQSKSLEEEFLLNLQQSSKGNGVGKELPPASGPLNPSNMAKEKQERSHHSQSKDRKRSPSHSQSPSKDAHNKKLSRSKERRSRSKSRDQQQSHSKSRERQSSRSRSKDRKHPRSRERRCSSSSSSRERKTSRKRASHEKSDNRGRERQSKSAKERRRSRSRSFSRSSSRERRRILKSNVERSNRHKSRSRSTSRDRKRHEDRSENSQRTAKSSCKTEPKCRELNEPTYSTSKTTASLKIEKDARAQKSTTTASLQSVKQEVQQNRSPAHGLESSTHDDQTRTLAESKKDVSLELKMLKLEEIKQEKPWPTGAAEEMKDIKKEEQLNLCEESNAVKDIKKEAQISPDIFSKESSEWNDMKLDSPGLGKSQACNSNDETKAKGMVKNIKIEQIWPDEDQDFPCCSDNPLVINLDTLDIDSENCKMEESHQSPSLTEQVEMTSVQPSEAIKQEPVNSSDEDISVDYLIDNLDFIKKEKNESSMASSADAVEPKPAVEEDPAEKKPVTESVAAGVKSKSQGKRVTWNLQEPEGPQSEKLSKIALFKLKLKQEGSRRSSAVQQTFGQDKTQAEPKLTANVSSPLSQDESGRPTSDKEVLHDPHQKEKYMKKLHMQERAIEEVKLAIKPFYQKRDITKEEYKEILRKAVQKVCHSKSGEINPVKVANLVKAYVDKYKHARKHKKEETGQSQHTEPNDFQTSA